LRDSRRSPSKETNISLPKSMRRVRTTMWELERSSILTVASPVTVAADVDMKNKSTYRGRSPGLLGLRSARARKPSRSMARK